MYFLLLIRSLCIMAACSISSATLCGKLSDTFYSLVGRYPYESVSTKEYAISNPASLTLNNINGSITIKSDWKKNSICVKAIKKASKKEYIETIAIKEQTNASPNKKTNQHITLTTQCAENKPLAVDYILLVPSHVTLQLTTNNGDITINDTQSPITATTAYGNIEINNTKNTVIAETLQKGNIQISNALGNIRATTNVGDISISDTAKSVIAHAQKGSISSFCTSVPQTSKIVLSSGSGSINLGLPESVNARLKGRTQKGTLSCQHHVTLKEKTMPLNQETWKQFKKEVDGILGNGEAEITLSSASGNISITQLT